jgi:Asp/Glu/Hydantoin racemase
LCSDGIRTISAAMIEASQPLLFLDTGMGGLSVFAKVRAALPQAPMVYAADYAGMPYGEKSEIEVATRVCALLGRLSERYRPRLVVIACNTASVIALGHVRAVLGVPVVGTVPAIKPASLASETGVFGLLGTKATIRQPYVDRWRLSLLMAKPCFAMRPPIWFMLPKRSCEGKPPIFRFAAMPWPGSSNNRVVSGSMPWY